MKLYQLILAVPDDFNPDELQLKVECNKHIELASEGFIGPEKIVVCDPDTEIPQQAADAGLFGNIAEGLSALVSDQIEDAEVKEIAEVALEDADSVDSEVEETTDSEKEDAE